MQQQNQRKSDGDLVRQTLSGETAAYEELVGRWAARIVACCHAKVRSVDAADDLAQETLVRGFRFLAALEDPDKFGPWLRGIAQRACWDWLKAKARSQVSLDGLLERNGDRLLADAAARGEDHVDRADEMARLLDQVAALPEDLREVLLLYYYQDVTYRELAETLGVSSATVNARLTKARAMLREMLTDPRRV